MEKIPNRRSTWGIVPNSPLQYKLILLAGALALGISVINGSVIYSFVHKNFDLLINTLPISEDTRQALFAELTKLKLYLAISSSMFVLLAILGALYISNRIVGPMYQIVKILNEFKNHNPEARVKLRPDDEFHEVAETINQLLDHHQGK